MTESRPVAQIQNPVKPTEKTPWSCQIVRTTKERFVKFCIAHEWTQGDVLDAALMDYMDNYERLQNVGNVAVVPFDAEVGIEEEGFDPFAGSVPE